MAKLCDWHTGFMALFRLPVVLVHSSGLWCLEGVEETLWREGRAAGRNTAALASSPLSLLSTAWELCGMAAAGRRGHATTLPPLSGLVGSMLA